MRRLILILIVVGAFFAGTLFTPQVATADHLDSLILAGIESLINTMIAFQTVLDAVVDNFQVQIVGLDERVTVLEGGGGLVPCDANNDGVITAEEFALWASKFLGFPYPTEQAQADIDFVESQSPSSNFNRVIDTPSERATLDILLGITCSTPLIPSASGSILGI